MKPTIPKNEKILYFLIFATTLFSLSLEAEQPKNVILFLVDDLGWMDLSCQ